MELKKIGKKITKKPKMILDTTNMNTKHLLVVFLVILFIPRRDWMGCKKPPYETLNKASKICINTCYEGVSSILERFLYQMSILCSYMKLTNHEKTLAQCHHNYCSIGTSIAFLSNLPQQKRISIFHVVNL